MKLAQRVECWYLLGPIALLALPIVPPLRGYMEDDLGPIWFALAIMILCWIPLSFLIHLIYEGGLNLRRWIWISALAAEIITLIIAVLLHLPELIMSIAGIGLAATPFLYILICITETWMPWLNRSQVNAFIRDLDL